MRKLITRPNSTPGACEDIRAPNWAHFGGAQSQAEGMRTNGGRRARRPRKVKYIPCGRYQIQFLQAPSPVSTTCAGRFARDVDMSRYEGISSQSAGLCPHNRQLRHLFFRFCKSWFLNPHSHSMASVLTSRHSSCIQFSVPSRIECRQVTPCRVSSASGSKIGTTSKTFLNSRL